MVGKNAGHILVSKYIQTFIKSH